MKAVKIVISLWQFVPPQEDEEPGMPTYRFAGTVNTGGWDKPFCVDISCEIDGRDCECEHVWGQNIGNDFDMWDAMQDAFMKHPGWNEDFQKRSEEYYASYA